MKFFMCFPLAFLTLLAAVAVNGSGDHSSCACAAQELGFAIDCSNQGAMNAALAAVSANSCDADCSSEVCHRNYLIMQSHHDYCLEDELPSTLEDAVHIYEEFCEECDITKKYDPNLVDCAPVSCTDNSGSDAWTAMVGNGCGDDCNSTLCRDNFRILKVIHDTCPEDVLPTAAEANFHDMEGVCNELHGCNLPNSGLEDPLVCTSAAAVMVPPLAVGWVVAGTFWVMFLI